MQVYFPKIKSDTALVEKQTWDGLVTPYAFMTRLSLIGSTIFQSSRKNFQKWYSFVSRMGTNLTSLYSFLLTHSFPMHLFSIPWKHHKTVRCPVQGIEKGCIGNEWVNTSFQTSIIWDALIWCFILGMFWEYFHMLQKCICENSESLSAVNYICKKLQMKMFCRVLNTPLVVWCKSKQG